MTPICKDDGDINDKNNSRPISVIDHIAKIESLLSYQATDFLEQYSFISMDQTSRHPFIDDWLWNANDCAITGTCLLDISKCFYSINHTIRLKKLEMYGITSTELTWLSSYLRGRKQVVKFHQVTLEFCYIVAIHRGQFQAQYFFLLFINDISIFLTSLYRSLCTKYVCWRCYHLYIRNIKGWIRM